MDSTYPVSADVDWSAFATAEQRAEAARDTVEARVDSVKAETEALLKQEQIAKEQSPAPATAPLKSRCSKIVKEANSLVITATFVLPFCALIIWLNRHQA